MVQIRGCSEVLQLILNGKTNVPHFPTNFGGNNFFEINNRVVVTEFYDCKHEIKVSKVDTKNYDEMINILYVCFGIEF
jgi:hypothetical protein